MQPARVVLKRGDKKTKKTKTKTKTITRIRTKKESKANETA